MHPWPLQNQQVSCISDKRLTVHSRLGLTLNTLGKVQFKLVDLLLCTRLIRPLSLVTVAPAVAADDA